MKTFFLDGLLLCNARVSQAAGNIFTETKLKEKTMQNKNGASSIHKMCIYVAASLKLDENSSKNAAAKNATKL